ncbi:MAG: hypothetical protein KFH98_01250 [Gemmatimonadetes bacterium]|nr:hypothetical protein [Gemmatimonadota bacterium]
MANPPAEAVDIARLVLEHEADGSDPADRAQAVQTVFLRLGDHMRDLLGSRGVIALTGRALNLAMRQHRGLAGVTLSTELPATFTGLAQALAKETPENATEAGNAILAHFLHLLIMLLGYELAMHPVRKLWPHAMSSVTEIDE